MNIERFKEIRRFISCVGRSSPSRKGYLILQLGPDLINASLTQHDGLLHVIEDGKEQTAEDWIVHRVAMLDLLAQRISACVPDVPSFVTPKGEFLDEIERAPSDQAVGVQTQSRLFTIFYLVGREELVQFCI